MSQRQTKAALAIQRCFLRGTARVVAAVRTALQAAPPGAASKACEGNLEGMAAFVGEVLGPNAWVRAILNAPDEWDEDEMHRAMRGALCSPALSSHVELLARPTFCEQAMLGLGHGAGVGRPQVMASTAAAGEVARNSGVETLEASAHDSSSEIDAFEDDASDGDPATLSRLVRAAAAHSTWQKVWVAAETSSAQFSAALPVAEQRAIHAAFEEVLEPVLEAILEEEGLDGHDLLPLLDIEPASLGLPERLEAVAHHIVAFDSLEAFRAMMSWPSLHKGPAEAAGTLDFARAVSDRYDDVEILSEIEEDIDAESEDSLCIE